MTTKFGVEKSSFLDLETIGSQLELQSSHVQLAIVKPSAACDTMTVLEMKFGSIISSYLCLVHSFGL